jgi:hypothetical protein
MGNACNTHVKDDKFRNILVEFVRAKLVMRRFRIQENSSRLYPQILQTNRVSTKARLIQRLRSYTTSAAYLGGCSLSPFELLGLLAVPIYN